MRRWGGLAGVLLLGVVAACGPRPAGVDLAARGPAGTTTALAAPSWRLALDPATGWAPAEALGDLGGRGPRDDDGASWQYFAGDVDGLGPPFVSITVSGMTGETYEDPRAPVQIDGHVVLVHEPAPAVRSLVYRLGGHAVEVRSWGVATEDLVAGLTGGHIVDGRLVAPRWPAYLRPVVPVEAPAKQVVIHRPVGAPADGRDRLVLSVHRGASYAWVLLAGSLGGITGPPGNGIFDGADVPPDLRQVAGHPGVPMVVTLPDGSVEAHLLWRDDARGRAVLVSGHLPSRAHLDAALAGLRELDEASWQALPHHCTSGTTSATGAPAGTPC